MIYNGENQFDKIKCTYNTNDVVHNDQITFSYTSQTFINHGDYTLNIYLTGDTYNKYYIASGKEKTNFEIKQRAISLIWDSNTTFTYDGDFKDVKVINITGHVLSERDAILSSIIYSGKQIDAGHHEMTATVPSDSNYVVTANNSCNFEISKRDLLITFKPTTKTYDGIIPQSFDYNVQENDIAPTDTLNNILTLRYTGDAVKNVDVGVYDYGAGYVANSLAKNYNITIIDNKLTIIQRDLNITFNEKNKTYDGKTLDKKDFTYQIDSLASKDSLEQVITLNINDECLQAIDANTYTIDATYEAKELAKNYNISIVSNKLNITKRNLNITFNSQNKTYDGKIFDNEFTYNINSLASTDSLENVLTLTLTGTALTAIDFGKYEINATYEENELAKNYNITVIRNELTINKRNLTITLDSQEKVYDGKVFDGEFTYNYDNLADTDNLNEVLSLDFSKAKEIINSGEHLINPECNGNSKYDNYNVNIVDNYLTINLRTLTINLNNQEKIYDGKLFTEDNEFDYEVVNLASTDRLEEVLELTIQGNAITAINQGSYEIDAQYVPKNKSNNYDITINGATYTIKKRQITAKWDDTNSFIYNGTIPSYKIATLNGVVAGEESNTLNSIQYNISDGNDGKYVGEHIVIASLRADSNYEFENSQVQTQSTYYVTKCELQITFEMQNKTYDGQMMKENEFTYEVDGLARTDQLNQVLTLTVTGSALTAINKGQYSINATYRENTLAKNYNIKIIGNTLTINPKEINLVWSLPESNYIYNGENQYPTVTRIVNAVVGEEEDIKSALVYQNYGKDAGEYDVSVTLNNNNYVIISNNDTCHYTIVKRDLTITFRDQEKVYDGNKFDEEEFTYDVVGLASTDQLDEILTLTLSGTAIDATSEGNDYIINATYELTSKGEKNYNVTIVAGKLVIKSSDEDSDEPVESEMLDEIKLSDLFVNKDVIKLWE